MIGRFSRGDFKPPLAVLNYDHPFARAHLLTVPFTEPFMAPAVSVAGGGGSWGPRVITGGPITARPSVVFDGGTKNLTASNREGACLRFPVVGNSMSLGSSDGFPLTQMTVLLIKRKLDTTNRIGNCFCIGTQNSTSMARAFVPFSDGTVYWDFGNNSGAAPNRLTKSGLTFSTAIPDRWIFTAGPRGSAIWQNGIKVASQSSAVTRVASSTTIQLNGDGSGSDLCDINFFSVLGEQWSDDLCRWWSSEPYDHLWGRPSLSPKSIFGGFFSPAPFLTIDGVEVTNFDKHTFELTKTSGRQARCNFRIPPNGPVSRPDLDLEVICTEDGTDRLFGGLVDDTDEVGAGRTTRKWDVSGGSYMKYLARRTNVTEDRPEETLADRIEYLRSTYLDVFGVTLDAGQVTGPTLPAQTYDSMVLQDVFNDITQQSGGYAGTISDYKVLSFKLPTANVAPFDITDATGLAQRDVKVKRTNLVGYGNRVIVKFGRAGQDVTYRFTGDGVTDTFTLGSPISGPIPYTAAGAVGYAIVAYAGNESLGGLSSTTIWLYDPVAKTIFRTLGPPTNGVDFYVTFVTNEQPSAIAENGSAATNPHELTVLRPAISDGVVAQALADALLAVAEVAGLEVEYETWEHGIEPDMTQTIDLSSCGISSTTFTITQVTFKFDGDDRLKRFVRAAAGDIARPELLPQAMYDQWDGIGLSA